MLVSYTSIGVSLVATKEEKFSSRKRVFVDLANICWDRDIHDFFFSTIESTYHTRS